MYAIIEDSGTQIRVRPGDLIEIDPRRAAGGDGNGELDSGESASIRFDRVLMVGALGDSATTIGQPYIEGASVTAEVLGEILGKKVDIFMYRRRKGYRRRMGHRQRYVRVRITGISA